MYSFYMSKGFFHIGASGHFEFTPLKKCHDFCEGHFYNFDHQKMATTINNIDYYITKSLLVRLNHARLQFCFMLS